MCFTYFSKVSWFFKGIFQKLSLTYMMNRFIFLAILANWIWLRTWISWCFRRSMDDSWPGFRSWFIGFATRTRKYFPVTSTNETRLFNSRSWQIFHWPENQVSFKSYWVPHSVSVATRSLPSILVWILYL